MSALSEDQQRAIESIKQADAAVKLAHEKFSALAAENAAMHETIEAVRSVADNSSGIAGWHLNGDIATWEEILPEINDIETPATDAFLAEIERKAIRKFINSIEHILRDKLSPYDTEEMLEAMRIFLEEQGGEQK
ncbi:hypothetical protein [Escherichia coli]|uniref:hypothetical protein n=1 Tax=Escherichia coli TaxID=562 RepID=UPI00390677D7